MGDAGHRMLGHYTGGRDDFGRGGGRGGGGSRWDGGGGRGGGRGGYGGASQIQGDYVFQVVQRLTDLVVLLFD